MRKVAIVTGSRADWGLLAPIDVALRADARILVQLVVTGMHLAPQFGLTVRQIEAAGHTIEARVDMLLANDSPAAIARSLGLGTIGLADALERLRPDLLLVLGDRFEILAAAQAALLMGIPIAHVHGGELTAGANDDAMRHAITKMACLHFAAAPAYARRIVQMGAHPDSVHVVGAPGIEAALSLEPIPADRLDSDLGLPLRRPTLLVTYHPETRADDDRPAVEALLAALAAVPDARIVITGVNADRGHREIVLALQDFAKALPDRVTLHDSLGQRRYFSVLRRSDAVVGNSSSGIIEAPAFGVPTVNVGERQAGRLRAASVIDCLPEWPAIEKALRRALDPGFRAAIKDQNLPWAKKGTSLAIANAVAEADLPALKGRAFYDLPEAAWV